MSVPVQAEKLFSLGPLPVTNSLLTGWILVALFVTLASLAQKRSKVPRGVQNALEALIEFMLGFMDQVTRDRARSRRFLPFVGTLFMLILASNWLGLLPGVGSIGFWHVDEHGARAILPFIRPATSDLNMTLALGVASVVVSNVVGVVTLGFFRHWGKFIQVAGLVKAARQFGTLSFGEALIGVFTAIIDLLIGFIELVSECAKMVSLSLRLFGNVFAGEVLLHVISSLQSFLVPTPFLFLEVMVGLIQAMVFSLLTLVYLTLATEPPHGEHHDEAEHAHAIEHAEGETLPRGAIPPHSMGEEQMFPETGK